MNSKQNKLQYISKLPNLFLEQLLAKSDLAREEYSTYQNYFFGRYYQFLFMEVSKNTDLDLDVLEAKISKLDIVELDLVLWGSLLMNVKAEKIVKILEYTIVSATNATISELRKAKKLNLDQFKDYQQTTKDLLKQQQLLQELQDSKQDAGSALEKLANN